MSASDDLSTPDSFPSDSVIESSLRRAVHLASKGGEEITVNLARSRAEQELGLPPAFFKDNKAWKLRSRDVVTEAVEDPISPEKPNAKTASKAGVKRKSDEAQASRKRSKVSSRNDHVRDGDSSAAARRQIAHRIEQDPPIQSDEESALSDSQPSFSEDAISASHNTRINDHDSDLSSVIDDPPPRKRRSKKATSPSATKSKQAKPSKAPKPKKSSKSEAKAQDTGHELGADEEEIKRLQSWLLKCGVRKLWNRELAPYSTSKEKIRHLKSMLDDVGMTGRFSAEKARQIKEARELKAELEAAQEFNEHWGHGAGSGSEEEPEEPERKSDALTKRRRPKGLVDFGDSDDESE